jgi:4-hydroxy-tetrahydrodipicolinate synthase
VSGWHGVVVPMATPFREDGALDEDAARRVLEHLIEGGVHGVLILGTNGEAASIPRLARQRLVEIAAAQAAGRIRVYAGIGDNCVSDSVEAAAAYLERQADAVVAHLPGYFALSPEQMVAHYRMLAERIQGPLLIYNMPATTHMSIPIESLRALLEVPNIVGLKDSENDAARLEGLAAELRERDDFAFFVGVAVHSSRALALGADGIVPSSGNLVPGLWRELYDRARAGEDTTPLQQRLDAIAVAHQRGRTLGQSIAALKASLASLGLCGPTVLPPLSTLDEPERVRLRASLAEAGALPGP